MKNEHEWRPTKFVRDPSGAWRPTSNPKELAPASRLYAGRAIPHYQRVLEEHARGDLADLGCGQVPFFGVYRDRVRSTTCVDWPGSLRTSPYLDHEADLSQPLAMFGDDSFDTVLLADVLEHLPEPRDSLREIDRILRPGGVLIIGVPFLYTIHEVPHDYHRYTEHLLRLRLEELGQEVLEITPFGGPAEVILDIAGKLLSASRAPRAMVTAEQTLARAVSAAIPAGVRQRADRLMPSGYLAVSRSPAGRRGQDV